MKIPSLRWTIARRIGLAFTATGLIALVLAAATIVSLNRAGDLVAKSFDESVVTTNFVRATADDFARMRSEFAMSGRASSGPVALLERSLRYDLATTIDKLPAPAMVEAGDMIRTSASLWMSKAAAMETKGGGSAADKAELNEIGHRIDDRIETMINIVGQAAFDYKQAATAMVARDALGAVGLGAAAIVLLSAAALMLYRGITVPLKDTIRFAEEIAQGQLDGAEPAVRDDEIGILILAMRSMRTDIGSMMRHETTRRESDAARISEALESSRDGIIVADGLGTIQIANSQALDVLGLTGAPVVGGSIDDLRRRVAADPGKLGLIDAAGLDDGPDARETLLADGRRIHNGRSRTREGGFVGLFTDVTVLADQKASLDAALANMTQGLCVFDAGHRLKVVNPKVFALLGQDLEAAPLGTPLGGLLDLSIAAGNHPRVDAARLHRYVALLFDRRRRHHRFVPIRGDRIMSATIEPMPDGSWLVMVEDVTDRRRAEDRIAYMASHDALTGLPNRTLLQRRVEDAGIRLRPGAGFAVLCIDLDRFKEVNDTLGHATGDHLLVAVAGRLSGSVGRSGTVARLGGDEFAVLQTGVSAVAEAETLARKITALLEQPFEVDGHLLSVGASIGVAVAPQDGIRYGDLLKNADMALYQAKEAGRGTHACFVPDMDQRLKSRRALQNELKQAVPRNELDLHFQPLLDLSSLGVCAFEALVRWRHPVRGLVMPGEFIGVAEEMGIIAALGTWVMGQACRQAVTWPDDISVAVNVSIVQLRDSGFADVVASLLADAGLPAHRLELEVTESVFMSNNAKALTNLRTLKQHGVRFAIDDFGTGYSSLSYLRGFAFDKIKIDRTFLKAMLENEEAEQIVRTIIGLGKNLGLTVIAEGVETPKQMHRLQQLGCDQIQGYLIGRPMPAQEIPGILEQHNGTAQSVWKVA